jgi:hypothetical protein
MQNKILNQKVKRGIGIGKKESTRQYNVTPLSIHVMPNVGFSINSSHWIQVLPLLPTLSSLKTWTFNVTVFFMSYPDPKPYLCIGTTLPSNIRVFNVTLFLPYKRPPAFLGNRRSESRFGSLWWIYFETCGNYIELHIKTIFLAPEGSALLINLAKQIRIFLVLTHYYCTVFTSPERD